MYSIITLLKNEAQKILMPKKIEKDMPSKKKVSKLKEVNARRKAEGRSYIGHYRSKDQFMEEKLTNYLDSRKNKRITSEPVPQ